MSCRAISMQSPVCLSVVNHSSSSRLEGGILESTIRCLFGVVRCSEHQCHAGTHTCTHAHKHTWKAVYTHISREMNPPTFHATGQLELNSMMHGDVGKHIIFLDKWVAALVNSKINNLWLIRKTLVNSDIQTLNVHIGASSGGEAMCMFVFLRVTSLQGMD